MESVISPDRLVVTPPLSEQEAGFDDCCTEQQIETRIREITGTKLDDVRAQVAARPNSAPCCIVCADTIVVVRETAAGTSDTMARVLGKPPAEKWEATVRRWFIDYYRSGCHEVWTCLAIADENSRHLQTVRTSVAMGRIDDWWIDWYVSTKEPVGKAGGYGIQGLAAHMIESVTGSLTNVIGLPMMELVHALRTRGILEAGQGDS